MELLPPLLMLLLSSANSSAPVGGVPARIKEVGLLSPLLAALLPLLRLGARSPLLVLLPEFIPSQAWVVTESGEDVHRHARARVRAGEA